MFTGRCDAWVDLRNRLPFTSNSIDAFYSHHVVEHLPDLHFHFKDVFRCLKPGGVYRIGGPNGDAAIHKFLEGDKDWFGDFPEKRKSIGGKLVNFIFCKQEHLTILTYSFLEELLTDAGFTEVKKHLPVRDTGYPELFSSCLEVESENTFACPHTLILEAKKT